MAKNDGGPAFPVVAPGGWGTCQYEGGMTLRDYFAAHATDADVQRWIKIASLNNLSVSHEQAKFMYADAMITAREKSNG
jgi:hypothetical protein